MSDFPANTSPIQPPPPVPGAGPSENDHVLEMRLAWLNGERLSAADLFARNPGLAADEEAAFWLVYHELGLLERHEPDFDRSSFLARYPRWRDELMLLMRGRQQLGNDGWPQPGERLGECELLAELGRGGQGRVFLARQTGLGGRIVVLKCAKGRSREHLNLARLQHTNVVPLYDSFEAAELRVLCLPWLGGTTLDRILWELRDIPPARRSGAGVLAVLETLTAGLPDRPPQAGPVADAVAGATWERFIAWAGACLADALHDAHGRGLVHFDIKPGNVLLAADATPLLLDFHIAHGPLLPDGPTPEWFGGTRGYASPEQAAAITAIRLRQPLPAVVDCRSDVYSLGLVLDECLGRRRDPDDPAPLRTRNPMVPPALAAVVARCLEPDPARRYQSAGELATDLRRWLAAEPPLGVPDPLADRVGRWVRRRPRLLAVTATTLAALVVAAVLAAPMLRDTLDRAARAEAALVDGESLLRAGDIPAADAHLTTGVALAADVPFGDGLRERLAAARQRVASARLRADLRRAVDGLRFLTGLRPPSPARTAALEQAASALWAERERFSDAGDDLADLGELLAELQATRSPAEAARTRTEAAAYGPPRAGYAAGRRALAAGDVPGAVSILERLVEERPEAFWPHYLLAVCRYRQGRPADADRELSVCVALAPDRAECRFDRGVVRMSLGDAAGADADFARSLTLDATLSAAAVNRGVLAARREDWSAALASFRRARDAGEGGADLWYNLALAASHVGDTASALADVRRALALRPDHADAAALLRRLSD